MTVESAANVLGVVQPVVRRMIRLGKIPATKIGKAWIIPRDAFVRMIERRAMRQLPPIALEDEL
jgi:excisionase family DNA binding protein